MKGKPGDLSDTDKKPGTTFEYGLRAFEEHGAPAWVHVTKRVWHALQDVNDDVIESRAYSDGFGRVLQTRALAEDTRFGDPIFGEDVLPGTQGDSRAKEPVRGRTRGPEKPPNVLVSGWQRYDNKGRVIEKFEPFYGTGFGWAAPVEDELGAKATLFYDAAGRLERTLAPDGSLSLTVYGIPVALDTPERFRPSPWESYSYDANDNAGRTPSVTGAQNVPEAHRNTPASAEVDALGRVVTQVARLPDKALTTRTEYDLRGNVTAIIDPVGRRAFENFYDLANRALRTESIDAGQKRFVFDAAGNGIERRDAKSALTLTTYDAQNQPATLWARDDAEAAVTLRQRIEYGDAALGEADARDRNLLGKPWRAWDEAGRVDTERVDFKGNILESVRRVISDETLEADREWRPDWLRDGEGVFEDREYLQSARFDALNRVVEQRMPVDVEGRRRVVEPRYNRAGALEGVSVDGRAIVERIAYDAKGQRTLEVHGNGVLVRWAYDPETFRLVRQRAERCESIDGGYRPEGAPLRDTAHAYDLVGNIVAIHERSPDSGVDHADELDRVFAYDALYRLTFATGREADVQLPTPWDPAPKNDAKATRPYTEAYEFDDAGNLVRLKHVRKDGDGGTWVRELEPETASNRLQSMTVGESVFKYRFDPAGNMQSETESRRMFWDHADRMKAFATDDGSSESLRAQYLYGADGMRVKKFVRPSSGQSRSTTYLGEAFEAHRHDDRRNDELHVGPIRRVLGECFDDDPRAGDELKAQWELADHLASVTVCTNTSGDWTNIEEFTPFAETSFGGFAAKRYRFNGKERDEESEFGYYCLRYLAPWLGRWTCADPLGPVDGPNVFVFARGQPLGQVDRTGGAVEGPDGTATGTTSTTRESEVEGSGDGASNIPGPLVARDYDTIDQAKRAAGAQTLPRPSSRFCSEVGASAAAPNEFKVSVSGGRGVYSNSLSQAGPTEAELAAARRDPMAGAELLWRSPESLGHVRDLEQIEFLSHRKGYGGNVLADVAKDITARLEDRAGAPATNPVMRAAMGNAILHIFGQAILTTLFGREAADFAGDAHERQSLEKLLRSSPDNPAEARDLIDTITDLVNNALGQALGERVRDQLRIVPGQRWTAELVGQYVAAVEQYLHATKGWTFEPMAADNAILGGLARRIDEAVLRNIE